MGNYLYNGLPFPQLPTSELPYAYIVQHTSGDYYLRLTSGTQDVLAGGYASVDFDSGTSYMVNGSGWETTASSGSWGTVVWANFDVYYAESVEEVGGTIYLPASYPIDAETGEEVTKYGLYPSDPVPVSPVKLNPAAMMQGFMVGKAIRRNRT